MIRFDLFTLHQLLLFDVIESTIILEPSVRVCISIPCTLRRVTAAVPISTDLAIRVYGGHVRAAVPS